MSDDKSDPLFDYLDDEDELKWLEKMRRKGVLNDHGKNNLCLAREIHG